MGDHTNGTGTATSGDTATHMALVVEPYDVASAVADLVADGLAAEERALVVYRDPMSSVAIELALEERKLSLSPMGAAVELVHRSGGNPALIAAAQRTQQHATGGLRVIMLDPSLPPDPQGDCGSVVGVVGGPLRCICVITSPCQVDRLRQILLAHEEVTAFGVRAALDSREGRLLALDLLLGFAHRLEDLVGFTALGPDAVGDTATLSTLVERHRARLLDRRQLTKARSEATTERHRRASLGRSGVDSDAREPSEESLAGADGDLSAMLHVAARSLGHAVLLEDPAFRPLHWAGCPTCPPGLAEVMTPGRLRRLADTLSAGQPVPVRLGTPDKGARLVTRVGRSSALGYLSILTSNALPEARGLLLQLTPMLAAGLRPQRSLTRLLDELGTQAVSMLVAGMLHPATAEAVSRHLQWPTAGRVAAVLPPPDSGDDNSLLALSKQLREVAGPTGVHDGAVAVLIGPDPPASDRLAAWVSHTDQPRLHVGVGEPAATPGDGPLSFKQATWAARMALATGRQNLCFEDLAIYRLLLPGREVGDPALEEPIRRLEEAEPDLGFPAVQTLAAYLDSGCSPRLAAQRLNVHVNSLAYRLQRIASAAGMDLRDPEARFSTQLALRMRLARRLLESG